MKNTSIPSSGRLQFLPYLFFVLIVFALALFSNGTYDSGDSISHFQIAKYSFQHPSLFLNLWGKPVFTVFASSFAQFGFIGINLFNILCAALTAYFLTKFAEKAEIKNSFLVFFFALFAPVYFVCLISGLTEIFFALIISATIYFTSEKKFFTASLLLSFLPFIRSEGFLILPLMAALLAYRKQFKFIPVLGTGTLLIFIAGFIYSGNILWFIQEHPYIGGGSFYGHGTLFHFIWKNEFILGTPLVVLFILGIIERARTIYFNIKNKTSASLLPEELLLVFGSFFIYFIAHSIFWWKGWFASAGLIRVMAGIAPLAGIISLRGMNFLLSFSGKYETAKKTLIALALILVVWMPFKQHHFPRTMDFEQKYIKASGEWIKNNHLSDRKIFYQHPSLPFMMNFDPFNDKLSDQLWAYHPGKIETDIPANSLVVWDSHFSPLEGKMPLTVFTNKSGFKLLNSFTAEDGEMPKGWKPFQVFVFERINNSKNNPRF